MNKPIAVILALTFVLLSSCATKLTREGASVRTLNPGDNYSECTFLSVITAKSPELAITPSQEAEYVMNDARNKVAQLGGTHMKIVTQNHGAFTGATINAEAFRCQ